MFVFMQYIVVVYYNILVNCAKFYLYHNIFMYAHDVVYSVYSGVMCNNIIWYSYIAASSQSD